MYRDQDLLDPLAYYSDNRLIYDIDTQEAQSGASVFTYGSGAWFILGVHHGYRSNVVEDYNIGARFRQGMYDDVCDWIASVPSAHDTHSLCN